MKDLFPGYYRPTKEEFTDLWENCVFTFDANVILKIYLLSPQSVKTFQRVLNSFSERIWLSHQAILEYQKNRLKTIKEQDYCYTQIGERFSKNYQEFVNMFTQHPTIDLNKIKSIYKNAIEQIENVLRESKSNSNNLEESDPLREALEESFKGKIGQAFNNEDLMNIYKQGEERYSLLIPPGYKDNKKPYPEKFGDLVLWFQIIEFAKNNKKPLILITNDRKDDWWLIDNKNTVGPRPELIEEIRKKAGIPFYMYQFEQFIEQAQKFLELEDTFLAEVRQIEKKEKPLEPNDDITLSYKGKFVKANIKKIDYIPCYGDRGPSGNVLRVVVNLIENNEQFIIELIDNGIFGGITAKYIEQFPLEHKYWRFYKPEEDWWF